MAEGEDFDFDSIFPSEHSDSKNNVTTQEAGKAANFLLNVNDDLNASGEVIEYFDFSKQNEETRGSKDTNVTQRELNNNSSKMSLEAENLFNQAQEEVR